ncbi:MAG: DNA-binding protein [Thiothrix sp.]|nr:MAG: DNA-binding protein [Thiothrix sp.]
MANLIVHNLKPEIIDALKQRVARHGHSTEMEHRIILREVLITLKKRSLAELLRTMPSVGTNEDFASVQTSSRSELILTRGDELKP